MPLYIHLLRCHYRLPHVRVHLCLRTPSFQFRRLYQTAFPQNGTPNSVHSERRHSILVSAYEVPLFAPSISDHSEGMFHQARAFHSLSRYGFYRGDVVEASLRSLVNWFGLYLVVRSFAFRVLFSVWHHKK